MTRSTHLFLAAALAIPACDSGNTQPEPAAKAEPSPTDADAVAKAAPDAKPEVAAEPKPDVRVVASGLDVGQKFRAFEILNCDSGEEYCQVCRYGGSPKIMAVGTVDDPEFHEDLKDIQAIVAKYGEDKVKAFAVITNDADGKLGTPMANKDELLAKAKDLRTKLGLTMPVVLPAPEDGASNETWDEHYRITKSRTVMFTDSRNTVKYSGIAPENFGELDTAIASVVGS